MTNAISKTQTSIAEKFTASGVDINESQTQNSVEQFIAKLSYILHNFFTKSEFNVGLNDDNINKAVIKIAVQCKYVLERNLSNSEGAPLQDGTPFEIELIPNVKIKLVIKDNVFKVYIVENEEAFYFPKTEKLLSIDLNEPNKMKICIKIMDKVLFNDISPYKPFYEFKNHKIGDIKLINFMDNYKDIVLEHAKLNLEDFKSYCISDQKILNEILFYIAPLESKVISQKQIILTGEHYMNLISFYFIKKYNNNIEGLVKLKTILENIYQLPNSANYNLKQYQDQLEENWALIIGSYDKEKFNGDFGTMQQYLISSINFAILSQ